MQVLGQKPECKSEEKGFVFLHSPLELTFCNKWWHHVLLLGLFYYNYLIFPDQGN